MGSGFYQLYTHMQSDLLQSQLVHAIDLAHHEAMTRGTSITLCHSEDHETCSGQWNTGYIVISDDSVLFRYSNKIRGGQLHWRAFPRYLDHVEYLSDGSPDFQNGSFWFCRLHEVNPDWAIIMSQAGRVRTVMPDKFGEIKDEKGGLLRC